MILRKQPGIKCRNLLPLSLFILMVAESKSASSSLSLYQETAFDTTINISKPYKMNEHEFLRLLGKDDSSRAMISLFFNKRKKAKSMIFIPLAIAVIFGITYGIFASAGTLKSASYLVFIPGFIAAGVAIVLGIIGTIYLLKYSRKRLYHILRDYESGKPMPHKIVYKNPYFKKYLTE